ncbi:O-antigen ligase family protein [uncultured Planococcus sp.]|uniref:O-antigen ligase family protein n=1 Tax=Planococcus donghaensis TaxID=414778 RepID=UPI00262198C6|nr:O-antigen ligase family protein [uncultured Planococcus sp.]
MDSKKILILFIAFIAIQPIIDVLTTASIFMVETSLTVGVLLRTAYMALALVFLLWMARTSKNSRIFTVYLIGLALLIGINIVSNLQIKDPYYLFQELKFFNKAIYFHIVLFGFLVVYRQLKDKNYNIASQTTKYLWISGLFIGIIFIIAQLTGTSLSNYSHTKVGFTGWFYAGNEVGAIMAIVLPIMALYAIEKTDSWKKSWSWIPFILLSIGMLALGTKVGYGGIIIVLLSVLFGSLIMLLMKKRSATIKINLLISTFLTVVLIAITPVTPVFGNMFAHIDSLGINFGDAVERPGDEVLVEGDEGFEEQQQEEEDSGITSAQVQNLVFSSRETYAQFMKEDFQNSPILQQLFGMGFAGNYEIPEPGKSPTMIEMDFHDWFYSFGWITFLYMMFPFIWFTGKFLIHFVVNIKTHFTYFYILYGVAFLLGIGIAYTAGHVLTAPAVSIYVAAILAMLTVNEDLLKSK